MLRLTCGAGRHKVPKLRTKTILEGIVLKKKRLSDRRRKPAIIRKSIELAPGLSTMVDFNCAESPLSWLRTRKDALGNPLITDEQYAAGLRLYADFTAAHFMPRVTTDWQSPVSDGGRGSPPRNDLLHQSERVLAAKQRYYAALEEVGAELSPILVHICCHAAGIEAAEQILGMPRRSGKVVLQLALTRLARCYGIMASPGGRKATPMISSALPGWRPQMS
jgi:hypothetical protein